jgi:small subunit ribosomal protein S13
MVRIAGVNIPDAKKVEISLGYIFGIGRNNVYQILREAKIDPETRTNKLSQEEIDKIRMLVDKNYKVEGDLKAEISQNIKRLKNINSYRGERHSRNLPVRGQRTKTNARTKRGKKVTVGSGRKKSAEKT